MLGDKPPERKIGEFPAWFKAYIKHEGQTNYGILILALTLNYFELEAQAVFSVRLCCAVVSMAQNVISHIPVQAKCKSDIN